MSHLPAGSGCAGYFGISSNYLQSSRFQCVECREVEPVINKII